MRASAGQYKGWGEIVIFEACTASRIGEVSGFGQETSTGNRGAGPSAGRRHPAPAA